MQLDILPARSGSAAENMATDFLLLQRYPDEAHARFRHYSWHRPAFTFGYSQPLAFVRAQLPANETFELCRRPTGGGVVDHRNDWTYALVIPPGHPLFDARAPQSYFAVHLCLAQTLQALGQPAVLKESEPEGAAASAATGGPGVCFTRAELHDVLHPTTGEKIAGGAQKRGRHGLLFQGSIARGAVAHTFDWDAFEAAFAERLGAALTTEPVVTPWPELSEEELSGLVERYSSPEWNAFR